MKRKIKYPKSDTVQVIVVATVWVILAGFLLVHGHSKERQAAKNGNTLSNPIPLRERIM